MLVKVWMGLMLRRRNSPCLSRLRAIPRPASRVAASSARRGGAPLSSTLHRKVLSSQPRRGQLASVDSGLPCRLRGRYSTRSGDSPILVSSSGTLTETRPSAFCELRPLEMGLVPAVSRSCCPRWLQPEGDLHRTRLLPNRQRISSEHTRPISRRS